MFESHYCKQCGKLILFRTLLKPSLCNKCYDKFLLTNKKYKFLDKCLLIFGILLFVIAIISLFFVAYVALQQ